MEPQSSQSDTEPMGIEELIPKYLKEFEARVMGFHNAIGCDAYESELGHAYTVLGRVIDAAEDMQKAMGKLLRKVEALELDEDTPIPASVLR